MILCHEIADFETDWDERKKRARKEGREGDDERYGIGKKGSPDDCVGTRGKNALQINKAERRFNRSDFELRYYRRRTIWDTGGGRGEGGLGEAGDEA